MGLSRSVFVYQAQTSDDSVIEKKLKELAEKHVRYGFKKIFHKLRALGFDWNHKRVYRVYCGLKLNLRRKPKKRLPTREKVSLSVPTTTNHTWSLDYMSDALTNGRKIRTANVIDDCNREVLGIKVSTSLPAQHVTLFLEEVIAQRGCPHKIRMDNGPENISKIMKKWAKNKNIVLEYIQPGEPAQNGFIERFNRTYREEILDMNLFKNIQEVQSITDQWMREYNTERPHQSLGNLTPHEFAKRNNFSTFALY